MSAAQKSGPSSGGNGDGTSNGNQPQPEQNRKKGKLKEIFSGDFGTEPALSFVCILSMIAPKTPPFVVAPTRPRKIEREYASLDLRRTSPATLDLIKLLFLFVSSLLVVRRGCIPVAPVCIPEFPFIIFCLDQTNTLDHSGHYFISGT